MLLFSGCEKEPSSRELRSITFNATLEQLRNASDSKIILRKEEAIYWEVGDEISIGSQNHTAAEKGDLVNASPGSDFEDFNGVFIASLPEGATKFLGLHPYNTSNIIEGKNTEPYFNDPTLYLSATQPRRTDSTFSRKVFPMVAWYGGNWDAGDPTPFNLDFQNLGAIVRIQLFNNTSPFLSATINSITFTARDGSDQMQLSGPFTVKDFNTADPHLVGQDPSQKTVTITCDGLPLGANDLLSFYLVLPAYAGWGSTTQYKLAMTVYSSEGTFVKNFKVKTRRCGITYMRAMGIDNWNGSDGTPGLVGNGTAERPFKIYTDDDMAYLRECYNSPARTINNQPITENTHICLMRSDIVLTTANWPTGINNFIGTFTSRITEAGEKGITNNSQHSLFESVGAQGVVEGLTVISDVAFSLGAVYDAGFSPFCNHNYGLIKDCTIRDTVNGGFSSAYTDLAGICVTNDGTLTGCGNSAKMTVANGKHVGGICLYNNEGHVVQGCQVTSDFDVAGTAQVGGICYSNSGTVKDCFFGARIISSTASWGAIAYLNGATLEHCYSSHSATIITSGTVGGIVNSQTDGTVNYCYTESQLRGKCIGGIAVTVSGGKLINCFSNRSSSQIIFDASSSADYGGGLVGFLSGGNVQNSYINILSVSNRNSMGICGDFVGKVTGGKVSNCYAYEHSAENSTFYGTADNITTERFEACYIVSGTQAGNDITNIAPAGFETFQGTLNGNITSLSLTGAKAWTGAVATTTPPSLVAYTVPSAKKKRR